MTPPGQLDALGNLIDGHVDYVLLAPQYPRAWRHGGEFIRTRVAAYAAAGLRGIVIDYSAPEESAPYVLESRTGQIVSVNPAMLPSVTDIIARGNHAVLAHSPTPELQHLLVERVPGNRLAVWFHGYEVRDHRRLHHNTTTAERALLHRQRDQLNKDRFEAARRLFVSPESTVVFVSDYQRRVSEIDVGTNVRNSLVIPNFIDGDYYRSRVRTPSESSKILLMRGFNARNYGNDIAVQGLLLLSAHRSFPDLDITLRGFGKHFDENARLLRHLPNVHVEKRYSSPAEMATMHYDHGVFLCPTRWDTQGVMLGEAMASGMVAITNPVAAIPEFTDASSSILADPDDPRAFANALWHLITHPELMPLISQAAARRVREQCGREATVDKEIALIGRLIP